MLAEKINFIFSMTFFDILQKKQNYQFKHYLLVSNHHSSKEGILLITFLHTGKRLELARHLVLEDRALTLS